MIPLYGLEQASSALEALYNPHILTDGVSSDEASLESRVLTLISEVRSGGDRALQAIGERFQDPIRPEGFEISKPEIEAACARVPRDAQSVLRTAADNIRAFGQAVIQGIQPAIQLEHREFSVGLDWRPVEAVGCYVPGGRYPLPSTALMTALTAKVAGVPHVVVVTPKPHDEILFACHLAGVDAVYQLGGAQAVAALAYGTETIPKVDMVVGPGNAFVAEAKRQLQGVIGIDMLAGPSEVTIIADSGATPRHVALELLAQAEHDPDARAYLLTPDSALAQQVADDLPKLVRDLHLPEFVQTALSHSGIFVLSDLEACVNAANHLAPEHLVLLVKTPETLKPQLKHYGTVFMGYGATVPLGDYMAGPNHTLPTHRTARFSGALNPMTFLRAQGWVSVPDRASRLAQNTARFATIEGLTAHQAAAASRQ